MFEIKGSSTKLPKKNGPGYILYTPIDIVMNSGDITFIDLGVKIKIPQGYIGMLCGRVSPLCRGIDPLEFLEPDGLTIIGPYLSGEKDVGVLIKNVNSSIVQLKKGDPICQLVIVKCFE